MLGYTRLEFLGMSVSDIEVNENPEGVAAHIQKIIETGSDRFTTRHRRKDGSVIDVEISGPICRRGAAILRFHPRHQRTHSR